MSKIEIDFNNLKYNLYEILNVPMNSDETKIKKSFMRIIKNFHPDKNSELEEEIYYHLILSNQILLNKETRKKYDEFISHTAETFNELKSSFNKTNQNIEQYFPSKDKSTDLFRNKINELNKKHGYDEHKFNESVMNKFSKIKENRDVSDIKIDKEEYRDKTEFNKKFDSRKEVGKMKEQIIEYKGAPTELSTYVIGEQYTSLSDIDKLYIEDSVQSSKYSSLDRAFTLQPSNINTPSKSFEDRMKEYKQQTDEYKNMKPTEFSTKKFNEWN
jgi:hypothetical protein